MTTIRHHPSGRAHAAMLRVTFVVLATLGSGCLVDQTVCYERDFVTARGSRPPLGRSSFHEVTFGRPGQPWDGSPAFTLVLPDGRKIYSAELTPAFVRSLPGRRTGGRFVQDGWTSRVEEVLVEPYAFALLEERVVAVRACAFPEDGRLLGCYSRTRLSSAPMLGDAAGKRLELLPLSYERMSRLFGKPPPGEKAFTNAMPEAVACACAKAGTRSRAGAPMVRTTARVSSSWLLQRCLLPPILADTNVEATFRVPDWFKVAHAYSRAYGVMAETSHHLVVSCGVAGAATVAVARLALGGRLALRALVREPMRYLYRVALP